MSARLKAGILIGTLIAIVWIGAKLGGAIENLGDEINGRRAQVMAER